MITPEPLKKPPVEVKPSAVHRYGVFAARKISAGEIIEECPVITVKKADLGLLNYWFRWQQTENDESKSALALGYGSLYNHSQNNNATSECDYDRQLIVIRAKTDIAIDEEILIYYADHWFEVRGIKERKPRTQLQDAIILFGKLTIITALIIIFKFVFKFPS